MRSRSALTVSSTVVVLGLVACGGSSSSSSSASSTPTTASSPAKSSPAASPAPARHKTAAAGGLTVGADSGGQLKFTKSSLSAKAGTVAVSFTNSSQIAHNLTIQQGASGPTVGATPTFQGGARTLTVKLQPGTYTFFCSVPGHRDGGMHGTLTVS
jgi:uncharacterized cupredoxin-like copper-binding protein